MDCRGRSKGHMWDVAVLSRLVASTTWVVAVIALKVKSTAWDVEASVLDAR